MFLNIIITRNSCDFLLSTGTWFFKILYVYYLVTETEVLKQICSLQEPKEIYHMLPIKRKECIKIISVHKDILLSMALIIIGRTKVINAERRYKLTNSDSKLLFVIFSCLTSICMIASNHLYMPPSNIPCACTYNSPATKLKVQGNIVMLVHSSKRGRKTHQNQ